MNDHFKAESTNDEAELKDQPRADEEMTHLRKNESRTLFLTDCRYVEKSLIEMLLE